MKAIPPMKVIRPARSVDWTTERIAALATPEVKQLRANAERLNDPEIVERCNAVLGERPRSGVAKAGSGARRRSKKKDTELGETA